MEESGEVRLSDHMEFSVSFEPGEDMAVLEQYLGMEDSSKFFLKLVLEGIFHVDGIRNGKFPKEEQLKCYYRKTNFYILDADRIGGLTDQKLDEIAYEYGQEQQRMQAQEQREEKWKCAFLKWSGSTVCRIVPMSR